MKKNFKLKKKLEETKNNIKLKKLKKLTKK